MSGPARVFLASGVARRMNDAGLSIRTPAAVRQAVQDGRLHPDMRSDDNVSVWSELALLRDIEEQARRAAEKRKWQAEGRRPPRGPVQGELPLGPSQETDR